MSTYSPTNLKNAANGIENYGGVADWTQPAGTVAGLNSQIESSWAKSPAATTSPAVTPTGVTTPPVISGSNLPAASYSNLSTAGLLPGGMTQSQAAAQASAPQGGQTPTAGTPGGGWAGVNTSTPIPKLTLSAPTALSGIDENSSLSNTTGQSLNYLGDQLAYQNNSDSIYGPAGATAAQAVSSGLLNSNGTPTLQGMLYENGLTATPDQIQQANDYLVSSGRPMDVNNPLVVSSLLMQMNQQN